MNRSKKLCYKLMVEQRGFQKLMALLRDSLNRSSEMFVMIIESVCALARYFQDHLIQAPTYKRGMLFSDLESWKKIIT